ncbi:hypothetical protein EJB05_43236, partial [Eragrostis curvula]
MRAPRGCGSRRTSAGSVSTRLASSLWAPASSPLSRPRSTPPSSSKLASRLPRRRRAAAAAGTALPPSTLGAAAAILRREGPLAFYRGFATSLAGTVPARALYMGALEATRSAVGPAALNLGAPEPAASAAAGAVAGLAAAVAAQVVWTPVDVISQRLMVQGNPCPASRYRGGLDAFRKILASEGVRGLYRGFGMSILTYAPSNAPGCKTIMVVQGVSAAMAGGAAALVTMPLDTIKTRMQVMDGDGEPITIGRTVCRLIKEGGWGACYRGLGPRWASMSLSATTMITTYEFLKRLSAKGHESGLAHISRLTLFSNM